METQQIRVVIVDDHQMIRETWKMILQIYKRINIITECASGQEAVNAAIKLQPDVVLMDINMSPMNGFEATQEIAKTHPQIGIIGISINNQPTYVRHLMQSGARGYVTKNSSKEEMIEAIIEVYQGKTFYCKDVGDKMINI